MQDSAICVSKREGLWRPLPLVLMITLGAASASIILLYSYRKRQTKVDAVDQNSDEPEIIPVGTPHPYTQSNIYHNCIYMDYNATTPVYPEVATIMLPYLTTCFGNPSSSHVYSEPGKKALASARLSVGQLINATHPEKEIFFTSCGTESDNRAVDIAIRNYHSFISETKSVIPDVPHIITCAIEHPAVICYLRVLKLYRNQIKLTVIGVDETGVVSEDQLKAALTTETALVTIMHSNNEVGTIQPIRRIADVIKAYNKLHQTSILLHSDAAQSIGKVSVDVQSLGVDLLTIVGHKYGAPKGVAALFVREGLRWNPLTDPMLVGGGQENGARGGTENVALIAALGEASRLARKQQRELLIHFLALKTRMLARLEHVFRDSVRFFSFIVSQFLVLRILPYLFIGQIQSGRVRVNGPKRSSSSAELSADLKLIRAVAAGNSMLTKPGRTGSLRVGDVSEGLVEQLPNTISVSFKGAKAHELVGLLSNKVTSTIDFPCGRYFTS